MTRGELADFWDEQLARWLRAEPLSARLDRWRLAYAGPIEEWAFPEPFIGDLLGSPRIVLLANNPGIAHRELQARDGVFASQIAAMGFTAWAATRPYEGAESPWVQLHGEIPHNWDRIRFARRFLRDAALPRHAVLNVELFPWHSPTLEQGIHVDAATFHEFLLGPLATLDPAAPVIALGVAWSRALDQVPAVVARRQEFAGFAAPSRRARLYVTGEGGRILVVWHSGSDKPPNAADTERLRYIWSGEVEGHTAPAERRVVDGRPTRLKRSATTATRTGEANSAHAAAVHRWVEEAFAGIAEVRDGGRGRVRLHVGGSAARIGWDIRSAFVHVWVKKLRDGDSELLDKLSDSASVRTNKADTSFRVHTENDALLLQELIQRHVAAEKS